LHRDPELQRRRVEGAQHPAHGRAVIVCACHVAAPRSVMTASCPTGPTTPGTRADPARNWSPSVVVTALRPRNWSPSVVRTAPGPHLVTKCRGDRPGRPQLVTN